MMSDPMGNMPDMAEYYPMTGEVLEDPVFVDITAWDMAGGNVEVDQTPLQDQIQKNKESLEKKLLARRPMETLVEQGIVPGYKTNPSLHMRRTKLERAKMGDMLKSKISHRPERTELVHRHILEDVRPDVDPSLCDRQRQLKRAKLADSLAIQLSHRPGPLELIQKNILHTDDPVEQAVKEGAIQFRPTAEGAPSKLISFPYDDDSSDTAPSPLVDTSLPLSPLPSDLPSPGPSVPALIAQFTESAPKVKSVRSESLGDININQHTLNVTQMNVAQMARSDSVGGSGRNLANFLASSSNMSPNGLSSGPNLQRDAPGKDRKKLKSKAKPMAAPKPRTIKFHEYKGPEASSKRKNSHGKKGKSAYDILLEQQQLILQWQLENKHKFPQILLPAQSKIDTSGRASILSISTSSTSGYMSGASSSQASSLVNSPANSIPGTPRSTTPRASTPTRSMILTPQDVNNATSLLNKLDGMKVNDLKLELKKRNLPVSGSKPTLIERLKPVLDAIIAAGRKQFKQPYRQISIPHGGLIILKPSPNSQLLVNSETNGESGPEASFSPGTPQTMHEGTPEMDENSMALSIQPPSPQYTGSSLTSSGPTTPFSPVGILSPNGSIHENSQLENNSLEKRHSIHSNMELELNLNYMEIEHHAFMQAPAPPPPPPPPPLSKEANIKQDPMPLPPPPTFQTNISDSSPHQFLPSQQPSQQILLAKAQLEAQLSSTPSSIITQPSSATRAGPKGQFIWPPVSVQSSQGTVITIRASHSNTQNSCSTTSSCQPTISESIMSSKPVAQLAAVFSQPSTSVHQSQYLPLMVQLPLEPVPASELGMTLPSDFNHRQSNSNNVGRHISTFNDACDSNSTPVYQLPLAKLPATLPPPQLAFVKEEEDTMEHKLDINQSPTDIIKQQQMQIEELQKALQRSKDQLLTQQTSLKCELSNPTQHSHGNTTQLLAQQIQNKQLARQMKNVEENLATNIKQQAERETTATSQLLDYVQSNSMDDVIDILMKNGDLPERIESYHAAAVPEKHGTNKPPSPPPLPAKNTPMEFPQLDFADMSFDFGQIPDIPEMLLTQNQNQNHSQALPGDRMEVDMDMDVQDWLDSLVVPVNKMDPE